MSKKHVNYYQSELINKIQVTIKKLHMKYVINIRNFILKKINIIGD